MIDTISQTKEIWGYRISIALNCKITIFFFEQYTVQSLYHSENTLR